MHTTLKQPPNQANIMLKARPDRKARQSRSKIKVMMSVFFDFRVVVQYALFPSHQTVNNEYYLSILVVYVKQFV